MVFIFVNVLRDGRGKIVRKVGDFKSNILNQFLDDIFCEFILKNFFILDINECVLFLCYNNGSCINIQGFYNCECVEGW